MTVFVNIDLGYEFEVRAAAKEVFEVLSHVPSAGSHFPKVEKLVDLGGGVFRWQMARFGIRQVNLQTIYASRYVANKAKGTVVWTPVDGEGNALLGGSWRVTDNKTSTALVLQIKGELSVPLPSLMKLMVAPVVKVEFERLVAKYIDNLTERFGGEAPAPLAHSRVS